MAPLFLFFFLKRQFESDKKKSTEKVLTTIAIRMS